MTTRSGRRGPGNGVVRRTDQRLREETDAPLSPLGREFLAYWHGKSPADGGFPTRGDVSPGEIVGMLPYIFILDVLPETQDGPDYRFRLVGTAIVDLEGEHTGRLLSEMFPDREAAALIWQHYRHAAAGEVWVRHESLRWPRGNPTPYEVVLAPLQDQTGRVTMLLGLAHALET
jgi:hypothetical protein